jgi:two-component system LytT family response regulator
MSHMPLPDSGAPNGVSRLALASGPGADDAFAGAAPRALRTVIADDEPLARARLRSLVVRHMGQEPLAECATGAETVATVRRLQPDLLLLDLQLPDLEGMQVVRELGIGALPALVFVTAHQEYALAAFEHDALDYLLKPVSDDRFCCMLDRVRNRLPARHDDRWSARAGGEARSVAADTSASTDPARPTYLRQILVRSLQKIELVEVSQVDWLQADGDYVRLYTGKTARLHRATLATLEQHLDPTVFVRIHRSTIVRTSRIRELEPYFHGEYVVVLHDGTRLKLSRTYRARLEEALGEGL